MRQEGVAAAARELKRLSRAYQRLILAPDIEEAEDAWVDFLSHAYRIHEKLRAACHGHPLDWMWWKKRMDERRDDPLLSYVHHARNGDTHGLQETTVRISGAMEHRLRLAPAIDKGVEYPVPQMPELGDMSAETVALLAGAYLEELVSEAASRLR